MTGNLRQFTVSLSVLVSACCGGCGGPFKFWPHFLEHSPNQLAITSDASQSLLAGTVLLLSSISSVLLALMLVGRSWSRTRVDGATTP
jgi:hypothetical protein